MSIDVNPFASSSQEDGGQCLRMGGKEQLAQDQSHAW